MGIGQLERLKRRGRMHALDMETAELTARTKDLASTDFSGVRDARDPFETDAQRDKRYMQELAGEPPYDPSKDPTLKQIEAGTHTFEGGKMRELGTKQEKRTRGFDADFAASDAGKQYARDYIRRQDKKSVSRGGYGGAVGATNPFGTGALDSDLDAKFASLSQEEQAKVMRQGRMASGADSARADRLRDKRRRSGGGIIANIPMAGTPGAAGGGKSRAQILKQKALDPRMAFGAPPSKRRSSAAVQREKYGIQGSRSGAAVQQRMYGGAPQLDPRNQAMTAGYQRPQQPGMRRGGFTGQGGMQAASAGGGGLSIDPSALQGVMSQFVSEFSGALNNITQPIQTMGDSLRGIANELQNLSMNVVFSGEAQMSLYIENIGDIKAKLTEHVTQKIAQMIPDTMNKTKTASKEPSANESANE